MHNGNAVISEALNQLPVPTDMWQVTTFIDPEQLVEIQQITSPNPLVSPRFRSTIIMASSQGQVPIPFEIKAATIAEAAMHWRTAARAAVLDFDRKMKEAQRRIIVPSASANAPFPKAN